MYRGYMGVMCLLAGPARGLGVEEHSCMSVLSGLLVFQMLQDIRFAHVAHTRGRNMAARPRDCDHLGTLQARINSFCLPLLTRTKTKTGQIMHPLTTPVQVSSVIQRRDVPFGSLGMTGPLLSFG